jgi:predicted Rossmann fold nucleotide-binding protein DprA/Smf involved in DNA uptake
MVAYPFWLFLCFATTNQPDTPLFFNCLNTRFGYNSIGEEHCLMQTLLDSTGLSFQQLNAQLLHLEMIGIIRAEGGRFSRVDPPSLPR